MIIYKITNNINGKIYIGQTIREFNLRMTEHKNKYHKTPISMAIQKYGKDNFTYEIIDYSNTIDDLNKKEIYWIDYFKSCDNNIGYNISIGGMNNKPSKKTLLKMSESQKGRTFNKETLLKMSISRKGRIISEEWRNKISKNSANKRSVINLDTKVIYDSVTEATKSCGKKYTSNITSVCNEKNLKAFGYRWMYYDKYIENGEVIRHRKDGNKKSILNIDTGFVYESSLEAMSKTGIDSSCIIKVCKGNRISAGGYKWKYLS